MIELFEDYLTYKFEYPFLLAANPRIINFRENRIDYLDGSYRTDIVKDLDASSTVAYDWHMKYYGDLINSIYGEFVPGIYLMGRCPLEKNYNPEGDFKYSAIYARKGDNPLYVGWIAKTNRQKFKELCTEDNIPVPSLTNTYIEFIKSNNVSEVLEQLATKLGY
jgi:hypothetical protein